MRSVNPAFLLAKTRRVSVTRKFVAGEDVDPINLELPGYYCDILVKFELNVTAGSSPSAATDWYGKLLKSMKIEATNQKPYLDMDDGRYLRYENVIRSHGSWNAPSLPAANLTQDVSWQYRIHGGDNFTDEYDISDVIATRGLSNLCFKLRWGTASDLGNNYTINSGKVKLEIAYAILQPGISEQRAFPGVPAPGARLGPSFWQPQWRVEKFRNINTEYGSLSYEHDFLSGFFLKEVLMMVLDDTDALRDDILTELTITDREGYVYFDKEWTGHELANMQEFELTAPLVGVAWFNLRDIFQKTRAGIYIANKEELKWHFTIKNVSTEHPATIVLVWRTHFREGARAEIVGKRPAGTVA